MTEALEILRDVCRRQGFWIVSANVTANEQGYRDVAEAFARAVAARARKEALEEAAAECYKRGDAFPSGDEYAAGMRLGAANCAAAIRERATRPD